MSKLDDVFQNPSKYVDDDGNPNQFFYVNKTSIISELGALTGRDLELALQKLYELRFHKMRFSSRDKKKLVALGQASIICPSGSKRYGDEAIEVIRSFADNIDMEQFVNELRVFIEEQTDMLDLLERTRPDVLLDEELCELSDKDVMDSIEQEYTKTTGKLRPPSITQWYYEWHRDISTTEEDQQVDLYISEEDITLLLRFFGKLFNRVSKCAGSASLGDQEEQRRNVISAGSISDGRMLTNEIVRMQGNLPFHFDLLDKMSKEDMLLIESVPEIREKAYKYKLFQFLFEELGNNG